MTYCYKTSSLQAFIPIPELCGNVAKVKSTFFSAFTLPTISQPSDAGAAASTEPPHIYVHFEDRHPERSQWYDINSVYAVNFINFNKKIRTFSVHAIYQLFAQMLSRPDNTVPNWQKVRAVHLNMKVSCFSSTNQHFFLSPQNRNQAKWDIRVTQIPCDGSNLLQVNIIIAFEEWTYPFVMTCTLPRLPQAVADTSQPTVAISQVWTGKMELTSSENLCILWKHFIILFIIWKVGTVLQPFSEHIS